jgi:hypothetical protein
MCIIYNNCASNLVLSKTQVMLKWMHVNWQNLSEFFFQEKSISTCQKLNWKNLLDRFFWMLIFLPPVILLVTMTFPSWFFFYYAFWKITYLGCISLITFLNKTLGL